MADKPVDKPVEKVYAIPERRVSKETVYAASVDLHQRGKEITPATVAEALKVDAKDVATTKLVEAVLDTLVAQKKLTVTATETVVTKPVSGKG